MSLLLLPRLFRSFSNEIVIVHSKNGEITRFREKNLIDVKTKAHSHDTAITKYYSDNKVRVSSLQNHSYTEHKLVKYFLPARIISHFKESGYLTVFFVEIDHRGAIIGSYHQISYNGVNVGTFILTPKEHDIKQVVKYKKGNYLYVANNQLFNLRVDVLKKNVITPIASPSIKQLIHADIGDDINALSRDFNFNADEVPEGFVISHFGLSTKGNLHKMSKFGKGEVIGTGVDEIMNFWSGDRRKYATKKDGEKYFTLPWKRPFQIKQTWSPVEMSGKESHLSVFTTRRLPKLNYFLTDKDDTLVIGDELIYHPAKLKSTSLIYQPKELIKPKDRKRITEELNNTNFIFNMDYKHLSEVPFPEATGIAFDEGIYKTIRIPVNSTWLDIWKATAEFGDDPGVLYYVDEDNGEYGFRYSEDLPTILIANMYEKYVD